MEPSLKNPFPVETADPLRACVHCGLCLEECPTYRLTGDENNSPRGRLLLWRAEKEGRVPKDPWIDFYTDECVGCLACIPVCPAKVPYESLLHESRTTRVAAGRIRPDWRVALAARLVRWPKFFQQLAAPMRLLRRWGLLRDIRVFPGKPALALSTADYASQLVHRHQPTGPTVALLTGCLMEALFREINFATVRVLVAHNIRVVVPPGQGCCGALHQHTGLPGAASLAERNRAAFSGVDAVVSNAAGCGLTLSHTLAPGTRVLDVLSYLEEIGVRPRAPRGGAVRAYVDLPCHLVHGQRATIPPAVLDATGIPWELAPRAKDCCGSGGVYHLQKPDNADQILREKATFLDGLPPDIQPLLVTANHVCMMQWSSARRFVRRPFSVAHAIQLLDPEFSL